MPVQIGWISVAIGLLMHLFIVTRQFPQPLQERVKMRPRQPSKREKELVERAYRLMEQKATFSQAVPFRHPIERAVGSCALVLQQ